MNEYHIYGMKLITDYTFRQLVPYTEDGKEYPEIWIMEGTVPEEIKSCTSHKWEFGSTFSWLTNNTLWIVVEEGNKITYELKEGADLDNVNAYLLGWGLSMLALQRGILAMHCSVVAKEDGAILIAGESGAGKSTLTSAFLDSGYRLMADDMAFVETKSESKKTVVYPAFPYQKLCRNLVEERKYDLSKLIYINEQKDKFLVPYDGEFKLEAVPIKGFIMLGIGNYETVTKCEMEGMQRFQVIVNNLFLRHLLGPDKYKPEIGALALQMASNVPIAYIGRPVEGDTTEAVVREAFDTVGKW